MKVMVRSCRSRYVWFAILVASLVGCASAPLPDAAEKFMDDTVIFNQRNAAIFNGPRRGSDSIAVETTQWLVCSAQQLPMYGTLRAPSKRWMAART